MNIYLYAALTLGFLALVGVAYNKVRNDAIAEQRMQQIEIILEDKIEDEKISSRPDHSPRFILKRMRTEND